MNTWFLLYDGNSSDGRGPSRYVGRTEDKQVAIQHYKRCNKSPYCNGYVLIITDKTTERACFQTEWDKL